VDTLLDQIPEDNGSMVIKVKAENIPPSQAAANGQKSRQNSAVYDPALVYILEFCTVLALRDDVTVELLGKRVVAAIQSILRDVPRYHPILVERATFYLFNLLQASYVSTIGLEPPYFLFSNNTNSPTTPPRHTTTSASPYSCTRSRASPTTLSSRRLASSCAGSSCAPRSRARCATRL
jgi:hypothetical protein